MNDSAELTRSETTQHHDSVIQDDLAEDTLEPKHLIRRSDVILKAGIMMLSAGTSSLRVHELMRRSAKALGLNDLQAVISYTGISLTIYRRGIFRTQVAQVPKIGVDSHKIEQLQQLSLNMPQKITANKLLAKLEAIERTPPLYPAWLLTTVIVLACAAVTVLTNGGLLEVIAVLPSSAIAFLLWNWLNNKLVNHLAVILVSTAASAGTFTLSLWALSILSHSPTPRAAAGIICASIFLVPAFPLVTGGLDLARLDLNAGIPRMVYASLVLLAIVIGVWIVASVSGISPEILPPLNLPVWANWTIRIAANFIAVCGWAMMFNCPLKAAIAAGIIALLGNTPRLIMLDQGIANHIATFTGCFIMGMLCVPAGRLFHLEKIIVAVPTMLVCFPGAYALRAMLYFSDQQLSLAFYNGASTFLVILSIILGLAAARMLTDPQWAFHKPDAPSLISVVHRSVRTLPFTRNK